MLYFLKILKKIQQNLSGNNIENPKKFIKEKEGWFWWKINHYKGLIKNKSFYKIMK